MKVRIREINMPIMSLSEEKAYIVEVEVNVSSDIGVLHYEWRCFNVYEDEEFATMVAHCLEVGIIRPLIQY